MRSSCIQRLQWCPCRLMSRKPRGRRIHARFLSHARHMPVSFPSHSVGRLRQGSVAIALHEGVEHPYIKKCALPISPPETLSHNVQPCTVFSIRCPVCKLLFGHRLQVGFSANAMTYLTQELGGDVADLIMAD